MSLCNHVGIQVGNCWQPVPSNCVLNHMLIPRVSEVIYYCDYFAFGNICMLLTSFYAHFFYFMCSTGGLTVKCLEICELWYVAYMLKNASVLHLTICQITWSLWPGTGGLTKLGLKFVSCLVKHGMYISGGVWEQMLGYSWALTSGLHHPCRLLSGLTHAWSI